MKIKSLITAATMSLAVSAAMAQMTDRQDRQHRGGPPAEVVEALQACATENGITLNIESRERPTEEQRAIIDSCMKEKGFSPPAGHGPHQRGHCPSEEQAEDDSAQ